MVQVFFALSRESLDQEWVRGVDGWPDRFPIQQYTTFVLLNVFQAYFVKRPSFFFLLESSSLLTN